jgi:hypothetical protein
LRQAWARSYGDPILTNKLGVVVNVYCPSYKEGIDRRLTV